MLCEVHTLVCFYCPFTHSVSCYLKDVGIVIFTHIHKPVDIQGFNDV